MEPAVPAGGADRSTAPAHGAGGTSAAIAELLDRIQRPYDGATVLRALTGCSMRYARLATGLVLVNSVEAEALLATMPATVRRLAIGTADVPERCAGEIRGPVLWSETIAARSASTGDPGVFVCATTTRAFDTEANRVLVAALAALRRAATDAVPAGRPPSDDLDRAARRVGATAERFLEHRTLADVARVRPDQRALNRTRAAGRRRTYLPALALLARAGELVTPDLVEAVGRDAQHRAIVDLAHVLRLQDDRAARTGRVHGPLQATAGGLVRGQVRYRPAIEGSGAGSTATGAPGPEITVGGRVLRRRSTDADVLALLAGADAAESSGGGGSPLGGASPG